MSKTQTYSTDPLGYYKILKSSEDADERALKINYREQAKEWHPDHNSSPQAMENFQKISVAYDILSDEKKRLIYDLAARSHSIENFPDIFSLKILTDMSGKNEANVRCFKIGQVRGRGWGYKYNQEVYICNNEEAKKIIFKNSLLNNLSDDVFPIDSTEKMLALADFFVSCIFFREIEFWFGSIFKCFWLWQLYSNEPLNLICFAVIIHIILLFSR